jgi:hypothetical protein
VQIGFCRSCLLDTVHGKPLYSGFSESLQEISHHPLQETEWPIVSKKRRPGRFNRDVAICLFLGSTRDICPQPCRGVCEPSSSGRREGKAK